MRAWRLVNAHPPSRSCLLLCCHLAAPLLALSPPSIGCKLHGSATLHRHRGWIILHNPPQPPPSPFDPLGSTGFPHPSGSTLVGRRPTIASGLPSSGCTSSLCPTGSVGLLPPASSTMVLSRQSPRLHPGPPDPLHPPGSLALRLRLGLLHHLPRRHWSAPWNRRPFLLHGSSLRQLHRGPPLWLWLWPGSSLTPPAPNSSCLLPGSSLLRHPHGLCLPGPSQMSVPPEPPPKYRTPSSPCSFYSTRTRFPGGGLISGFWTICVLFYLGFCSCLSLFGHVPVLI